MSMHAIHAQGHHLDELLPVIELWLLDGGYQVTVIANRIDGVRLDQRIRIFITDYAAGSLLRVYADAAFLDALKRHLAEKRLLSYRFACPYCNAQVDLTAAKCPTCGAPVADAP